MRFPPRSRASVAAALAAALTVLSVMVPLLDRGRDASQLVVVAPGTAVGYVAHHHGVCLQHGAAGWWVATAPAPVWQGVRLEAATDVAVRAEPDRPTTATHHSRAPPLA